MMLTRLIGRDENGAKKLRPFREKIEIESTYGNKTEFYGTDTKKLSRNGRGNIYAKYRTSYFRVAVMTMYSLRIKI